MKCENCGSEIKAKAKFCGACGQKVKLPVDNSKSKEKTKKKNKGKIITISVLSGVGFTLILLTVLFFTSPAYSVFSNMNSGKYKKASVEYRADVKDSTIQKGILRFLLEDKVDSIVEDYDNGELDYEEVVSALTVLDEMHFNSADEKMQEIIVEYDSNIFFENGKSLYKTGDYKSAVLEYIKIPESWSLYEKVEEELIQAYNAYVEQMYISAVNQNADKNYKEAIALINEAYDFLPDDIDVSKLDEIKSVSFEKYKNEIKNEVEILVADLKYADAFKLIDSAINFDNNDFFKTLKGNTEEKYVTWITTTVDSHIANEDYISAQRVVENALNTLPNNSKLKELKVKVENATPTYLLDVVQPYSKNGYKEYIKGETFKSGGKTFTNGFQLDYCGSVVFNVDSLYTTLSFSVGHVDTSASMPTTIKVYCDGILKTELHMTGEDLPEKITVDITGVKQLKFSAIQDKKGIYISDSYYAFGNVIVD